MFCPKCGTNNADGVSFCSNCGTTLQTASTPMPTPVPRPVNYKSYSEPGKGLAIASLITGIVSLIMFAIICGTLAIVFGAIAKKKGYFGGMATAGLVLGIVGIVLWLLMLVFCGNMLFAL